MKRIIHTVLIFLVSAILTAAGSSCAWSESRKNLKALPKIRVGMTKAQVREIMGEPVRGETYCSEQIWYYYTNPAWIDGQVTRDECTPICFDEFGKVQSWGRRAATGVYRILEDRPSK